MAKPSYKAARKERKGSATMEIEPSTPGTAVKDTTKPEPHTESLVPPLKPGQKESPRIGPTDPMGGYHADPGVVHPGEYLRPNSSDLEKT